MGGEAAGRRPGGPAGRTAAAAGRTAAAVRGRLRLLAVAVQFSTRLPVPAVRFTAGDMRRAAPALPLVGVAVAAVGTAVRGGLEPVWGPVTGTLVAIVAVVVITGALHEDGLADSVDGVWGGWDPEQRLAIMRDSRLGTYGTIALVSLLGLRLALLAPLGLGPFARALLAGHVLGRAGILVLARQVPALPGSSSESVSGRPGAGGAALALATVAAASVVAVGWWAPLLLVVCLAAAVGCAELFRRRLGGVTGDALGAAAVVVELAALAVVSGLVSTGLA